MQLTRLVMLLPEIRYAGFPHNIFSLKFQDLESPGKSLWFWKVVEKYPWKLRITEISRISSTSTEFGQLTLSKIVKIVVMWCHRPPILRLKCTKFDFGPRWGNSQRSPRSPSCIWRVLLLRGGKTGIRRGERRRVFSLYLSVCGLW